MSMSSISELKVLINVLDACLESKWNVNFLILEFHFTISIIFFIRLYDAVDNWLQIKHLYVEGLLCHLDFRISLNYWVYSFSFIRFGSLIE